jgi:hypothetical protein
MKPIRITVFLIKRARAFVVAVSLHEKKYKGIPLNYDK